MSIGTMLEVSLETLDLLHPGIAEAVRREIALAADDCRDRPFVDKPRKITIELQLRPKMDAGGSLDSIDVVVLLKGVKPTIESVNRNVSLRVQRGQATLLFHELSRENADQRPLPFELGGSYSDPEDE